MPKKLPIGIRTFDEIRTENYIYVDKTKEAYELINDYKYAFLARPRKFGKSLFLDTLRNIFEGNKELFEGLYIYDKWNWDEKYPVIEINWSGDFQTLESLNEIALAILKKNEKRLKIKCESTSNASVFFQELIQLAYEKHNQRVVILIDEYDKPILDVIQNQEQAIENRKFLKGLYSIIKSNDEYIKFCFLTGASKFSKVSIFSELNMFEDISLLKKYGNICGYTEKDIKENFKDYLEDVNLDEIKEWYGGYWFLKDKIYNPSSILQYLDDKTFKNYWLTSENPDSFIKLIKEKKYFSPNLSNLVVDEKKLDVFDIERVDTEVLLYQTGYLTIKEVIQKGRKTVYELEFPNYEVKSSFSEVVLDYFLDVGNRKKEEIQDATYDALIEGDVEKFINSLKQMFASISYYSKNIKRYEGFYAAMAQIHLQTLGIDVKVEDPTNKGRIDLTVSIGDKVYIMEFKVIKSEKEKGTALKQIKKKKYYEKYIREKEVYLVGVECSEGEGNIVNYECEKKPSLKKFSDKLNNNPSLDEVLSDKSLSDKSLSDELGNLEGPKGPKL